MKKLDPQYIVGFVDGEGCFCVGISKHKTLKRKLEIRALFEIELRADDRDILERLQYTLGCGRIYDLSYERYGWAPHVKYKVSSIKEIAEKIIPFFDRYPLQAKKSFSYERFRTIVLLVRDKKHLTDQGFREVTRLRDQMRTVTKKHYRNR